MIHLSFFLKKDLLKKEPDIRFIQVTHNGWDTHVNHRRDLKANCDSTDAPIAALLQDLDSDGRPELVVIVRSVGTGGYLSARSFKIDGYEIGLFGQVRDLSAGANPVEYLRQ